MGMPRFLDRTIYPYTYTELSALADVETGGVGVITSMRSALVTTLGWSEPSTALFKTPVDSAGRFLDVLVTRISSTVLEWRVRNAGAVTICTRRFNLGIGVARIYATALGVLVEFVLTNQNASECASAFVLEQHPNLVSDHVLYVIGGGHRTTAGTADGSGDGFGDYFAIDNGSAAFQIRCQNNGTLNGATTNLISASGRPTFGEAEIYINFAATVRKAGRIAQAIRCSSDFFQGGDERKVYIDTGTVAVFKTVGQTHIVNQHLMMRKSG